MKMLHPNIKNVLLTTTLLGAALLLAGCATSAPSANFTQEIAPASRMQANDEAKIVVTAATNVVVEEYDKQRIAQRIQSLLDAKKISNPAIGEKKDYEVDVTLTKYERGSAFARAMLAGLGQIHVNGLVQVYLLPNREKVGEFTINKTFAWGGIYGASTSIEDAELGFAQGIVDALTGQTEAPAKTGSSTKGNR
jgi:hypothetical protein